MKKVTNVFNERKYLRKTRVLSLARVSIAAICLNSTIVNTSHAGIDALVRYATPEGGMSNFNTPAIIKDQTGGYMTGGSILLRGARPKELNPLQIQTPKLSFDACTGSGDFRFGALSYISAAEFSSFLKGVTRASGAYLLKMSIKTACPQCEDIMSWLEAVARDINGLTMNQCSLAQSIASGVFSKITAGEKQHCMMAANVAKSGNDQFQTTRQCQDDAGKKVSDASDELESLLGDEFNLVWKALSKGNGADKSKLKELMMSISGTIIGKKEDEKFKFVTKGSLLHDKELLEKYIGSGEATGSNIKLYECDTQEKCLEPRAVESTLAQSDTLYGNVSKIMRNLVEKVKADKPDLSDEETALLGFSTIPILHLIEMEIATKGNTEDVLIRVSEYVEVICYDVITNFMQAMLNSVIINVQALERAQGVDDGVIRNFMQDAENIRRYLSDAKSTAFQKLQVITQVKQRLEQQSQEFEHSFGQMMQKMQ